MSCDPCSFYHTFFADSLLPRPSKKNRNPLSFHQGVRARTSLVFSPCLHPLSLHPRSVFPFRIVPDTRHNTTRSPSITRTNHRRCRHRSPAPTITRTNHRRFAQRRSDESGAGLTTWGLTPPTSSTASLCAHQKPRSSHPRPSAKTQPLGTLNPFDTTTSTNDDERRLLPLPPIAEEVETGNIPVRAAIDCCYHPA